MATVSIERRLAAILCADVVGYSRLMGADEEGTLRALRACRALIDQLIANHHGRVFGSAGDSVLAEFPSAVEAARCAIEIQDRIEREQAAVAAERRMRLRIGIALGDVMVDGENLMGEGVNIAARLEALAEPGSIYLSGTAFDQVEGKLEQAFEFFGEKRVKNIARPVRLYRVRDGPDRGGIGRRLRRVATSRPLGGTAIGLGLALAIGLVAWFLYLQPMLQERAFTAATVLPLPDKPSIAVLPFASLTEEPNQDYFSDGITDDLITSLSQVAGLFVIARNSVFAYKGRPLDVREVGRELGVRYVVEGSVQKSEGRVRVNAQLIDAATGFHLWAGRFERELGDIFALQDDVTSEIAATLKVELSEAEERRLAQRYTDSFEAYDVFLQGWEQLWRGTVEANSQARAHFERAIQLDPGFARAYANLALTYTTPTPMGLLVPDGSFERAYQLAQTALALDDTLPQVHWVLSDVQIFRQEYEQALVSLETALELEPNFADAYLSQGFLLTCLGKPEEALPLIEQAMRLNPRYPAFYLLEHGRVDFALGRYQEAITTFEEVRDRNPNIWEARLYLAASYVYTGRIADAEWELGELLVANPELSTAAIGDYVPYQNPADLEHLTDALRKAGLADS